MEEMGFTKNRTPFYVFLCSKCKQYSYVKTTQKTKKCLRCGLSHQVKNLAPISEVVKGNTNAKNRVITLQNELARKELGFEPALRADNDFSITPFKLKTDLNSINAKPENEDNKVIKFKNIIHKLQDQYKRFPSYLIELAALDRNISKEEIKFLLAEFINKKILQKTKEGLYFLSN